MDVIGILDSYGLLDRKSTVNGEEIQIICPFHIENDPSLRVNALKGVFFCQGCGATGNLPKLIAKLEGINLLLAMRKLLKLEFVPAQQEQESKTTKEKLREAWEYFSSLAKPSWEAIKSHYLISRGFTAQILISADCRINQNSLYPIILPLREQEKFKGYICRRSDDEQEKRYMLNPGLEKRSILVGDLVRGPVLLTEGYLDYLKARQFGFRNVACTLGWRVSDTQVKKLERYATVIVEALDNDPRGRQGARELAKKTDLPLISLRYPDSVKDIGAMDRLTFIEALRRTKAQA